MTKTAPAHERVSYLRTYREGKKAVVAYVDPRVAQGLKIVAGVHGQSVQEYLSGLVEKDIAAQRIPGQLAEAIRQVTERQPPRIASPKRLETALRQLTASIPR